MLQPMKTVKNKLKVAKPYLRHSILEQAKVAE